MLDDGFRINYLATGEQYFLDAGSQIEIFFRNGHPLFRGRLFQNYHSFRNWSPQNTAQRLPKYDEIGIRCP